MELTEATQSDSRSNEPSVSSALEHLVVGGQGVITKRIDLALLEGQELLSHTLQRAAVASAGIVLGGAAWFAGAAALVLFVMPDATAAVQLAAFALLNGACAGGLVTLAPRRSWPQTRVHPTDNRSGPTR